MNDGRNGYTMTAFTSNSTRTSKALAGATAFGAATLLAIGAAAPAMADDSSSTDVRGYAGDATATAELIERITSNLVVSDVLGGTLDGGDVNGGDITGGDTSIGDLGGDLVAPIAPEVGDVDLGGVGNGNAVGSGNELNAPIGSGNSVEVGDITGGISDVVDVNDIVDDVTNSVDVDGIVSDVTGSLSNLLD